MELKVERLVTTEKIDGTTEEKAILKGTDSFAGYTLTIVAGELKSLYHPGEPYELALNPIQTKLTEHK